MKPEDLENRIDKRLTNIEEEIRDVRKVIYAIERASGEIKLDLKEHMLRTALAEENIAILKTEMIKMHSEQKPIKDHVNALNWIFKAVVAAGSTAGAVLAVYYLWKEIL
jgi:chromosome segregation ATPase